MRKKIINISVSLFFLLSTLFAQETDQVEELKKEVEKLKEKVENLEKAKIQKEQENEMKKLLETANRLKTVKKRKRLGLGKKFKSGTR